MFTSDLVRYIKNPSRVDFAARVLIRQRHEDERQGEHPKRPRGGHRGQERHHRRRHRDFGLTLTHVRRLLGDRKPRSLKICALIDKRCRREVEIEGDYVGFTIDETFCCGLRDRLRGEIQELPDIRVVVRGMTNEEATYAGGSASVPIVVLLLLAAASVGASLESRTDTTASPGTPLESLTSMEYAASGKDSPGTALYRRVTDDLTSARPA